MKRWLILVVGLGIALLAGLVLLTGSPPVQRPGELEAAGQRPHDEVDPETEAQLKEILRSAEREDSNR